MFTSGPTKVEMEVAGVTMADFESEAVEVWPEHVPAYALFSQLQTQWRVGAGGATGLDYNTLYHKMDRMRLEPDDYEDLEADIRVMEYAALDAMSSKD